MAAGLPPGVSLRVTCVTASVLLTLLCGLRETSDAVTGKCTSFQLSASLKQQLLQNVLESPVISLFGLCWAADFTAHGLRSWGSPLEGHWHPRRTPRDKGLCGRVPTREG